MSLGGQFGLSPNTWQMPKGGWHWLYLGPGG